ncbi:MAG: hypothetical protein VX278_03395 [Myxococcota bacterium]|nr:hypothetical protein [Myxococcota bacterium]
MMLLILISCWDAEKPYANRYEEEPEATIAAVLEIDSITERESVLLDILSKNPKDVERICPHLQSKSAQEYCQRYRTRPHLWSISPSKGAPNWTGGHFSERLLFPSHSLETITPIRPSCATELSCAQKDAIVAAQQGNVEASMGLCASLEEGRIRWDCMFRASESIPPPNYSGAVRLCLHAGAYAPECHNHLLLKMATWAWIDLKKHQSAVSQFSKYWQDSLYTEQLKDVYWSMVASRVAGVTQPFAMEDFNDYPSEFDTHLRSAISLRAIFAADPSLMAEDAQRKDHLQLTKAHGPNSPRFKPRPVWETGSEYEWIYYCDIRGGMRPTSTDSRVDMKFALMTAAAMHNPPKTDLIRLYQSDEDASVQAAAQTLLENLKR